MPNKPNLEQMTGGNLRAAFPALAVRSVDEEQRTVELAFSSDAECEQWWHTLLVLEHSAAACDLDRLNNGGAVLINHDRDDYVAVVESARIDSDAKGRAVVRFGRSARAEEAYRDVLDGILRHVSVGFSVQELKLVETREGEIDVYRATKWTPYEISLVTIPMDDSVGVGRDHASGGAPEINITEVRDMPEKTPVPSAPPVDVDAERASAVQAERARMDAILALGREYNAPDDAVKFAQEGKSPEEFQRHLLGILDQRQKQPSPDEMNSDIGLTEKELSRYSFVKVLRALDPNNPGAQKEAAFELECSQAAARSLGRSVQGIVIPPEVLRRAYTTDTAAAPHGGNLVGTSLLSGSFIEMLRKRCLFLHLATSLGGLVGNIDIPKQLSGATAYVVGEDTDVDESAGDFGQVGMTPHTVGARSTISRRLLMQSTPDIEGLVRLDLSKAVAQKIDYLGLYGSGTDEPTGIRYTDGVNVVPFTTSGKPTWDEIVSMESEVAADNADVENMAYLFNARMRGHCKSTAKFAGNDRTIWEDGGTVNGYWVGITNQVSDSDIFFGNFGDVFVGMWGGLELTLDPYTKAASGGLRIVAFQDVDIACRNGESFTFGTYNAG